MATQDPVRLPELEPLTSDRNGGGRWKTVIYNNDYTPIDDVLLILIAATGCSQREAEIEVWEAHHFGKANVHFADREECAAAAQVISTIGVKTDVLPEWDDDLPSSN